MTYIHVSRVCYHLCVLLGVMFSALSVSAVYRTLYSRKPVTKLSDCVDVVKSEAELDRYNELKTKKSSLEEKLLLKLEQLYDVCLQEAVSTHTNTMLFSWRNVICNNCCNVTVM